MAAAAAADRRDRSANVSSEEASPRIQHRQECLLRAFEETHAHGGVRGSGGKAATAGAAAPRICALQNAHIVKRTS